MKTPIARRIAKLIVATVLLLFSGLAVADDYGGIPDRFFAHLAKNQTDEAIDFLYSTNPWVHKNSDQVTNLKGELSKLDGLVGRYLFHELVLEQRVGSRYAHLIYMVGYERQPLRFEIQVYKAPDRWRFQGVSFDARLTDDIDKLANARIVR